MKTYLDKLKNVYDIHFNGEYVVIAHTKLHILRPNGTLVTCRDDLRYASRITFLSGKRLLLCSNKTVFHMIDLTTGEDLWTAPYTKNNLNVNPIVISPNEKFAYTYDRWNDGKIDKSFISQLNLDTHETEIIDMYLDVGATADICCEDETTPCLLKYYLEEVGGKTYRITGVRLHDFFCQEARRTNKWKTKWYYEGSGIQPMIFLDSTDRVATSNLHIYTPTTGEDIDLLENETENIIAREYPNHCWLDYTRRYLCVQYQKGNAIIDIQERKIAATYAADYKKGCLISNKYWLGTEKGVVRKTFPAFEEIPPYNPTQASAAAASANYAKHPELW